MRQWPPPPLAAAGATARPAALQLLGPSGCTGDALKLPGVPAPPCRRRYVLPQMSQSPTSSFLYITGGVGKSTKQV